MTETTDTTHRIDESGHPHRGHQRWWKEWWGALAGLVSAAAALGVAEAVAATSRTFQSPVLDVGDRVVDTVPNSVKELAIRWFGTNDKVALLAGIGAILAVYAAAVGALAFGRRLMIALGGIAVFGLIGAWASQTTRREAPFSAVVPSLIGAAVGVAVLAGLRRAATRRPTAVDLTTAPMGQYGTGSRSDVRNARDFITALVATVGHFNGEGHCDERRQ